MPRPDAIATISHNRDRMVTPFLPSVRTCANVAADYTASLRSLFIGPALVPVGIRSGRAYATDARCRAGVVRVVVSRRANVRRDADGNVCAAEEDDRSAAEPGGAEADHPVPDAPPREHGRFSAFLSSGGPSRE